MPKATPTVAEYLAALPEDHREAITAVHKAIKKTVPKQKPYVTAGMGVGMIGYGKYRYRSASGREGEWFLIGLAAGIRDHSWYPWSKLCSAGFRPMNSEH